MTDEAKTRELTVITVFDHSDTKTAADFRKVVVDYLRGRMNGSEFGKYFVHALWRASEEATEEAADYCRHINGLIAQGHLKIVSDDEFKDSLWDSLGKRIPVTTTAWNIPVSTVPTDAFIEEKEQS